MIYISHRADWYPVHIYAHVAACSCFRYGVMGATEAVRCGASPVAVLYHGSAAETPCVPVNCFM